MGYLQKSDSNLMRLSDGGEVIEKKVEITMVEAGEEFFDYDFLIVLEVETDVVACQVQVQN